MDILSSHIYFVKMKAHSSGVWVCIRQNPRGIKVFAPELIRLLLSQHSLQIINSGLVSNGAMYMNHFVCITYGIQDLLSAGGHRYHVRQGVHRESEWHPRWDCGSCMILILSHCLFSFSFRKYLAISGEYITFWLTFHILPDEPKSNNSLPSETSLMSQWSSS